jgi:hypothetical protein
VAGFLEAAPKGVYLSLRLQPRASKDTIAGVQGLADRAGLAGDALKIKLTSAPIEGAANRALIGFLSKILGVKKSALTITSGHKSRTKRVFIEGATVEGLERVISKMLAE